MLGVRLRLLAVAALLFPAALRADDTHYQDFVMGGRAVGLGGAFTSLADDPSGLYYNPAGIADSYRSNLQVSTSLYGFERGSLEDRPILAVPGVGSLSVNFTDLVVVPASAGFLTSFGRKGEDGMPMQAYGVSVLIPSYRSSSASTADARRSYSQRVTDGELWSGVGYGIKPFPSLRFGLSAYYVLRTLSEREQATLQTTLADGQMRFQTLINDVSMVAGSVVIIAGAKFSLSPRWTVGASVQMPSFQVHGSTLLHSVSTYADPSGPPGQQTNFQNVDLSVPADARYAAGMRLGINHSVPHRYTFAFDLSGHLPVEYSLAQVSDSEARARLPFNPDITRHGVVNANVGAEVMVIREVSVAAGAYTNFSSAPTIEANPRTDQPPQVNLFGMTLALGYFGDYTLSRLGVVYSFGQGYDVIPNVGTDFQSQVQNLRNFSRARYFQSFFYIFVSSSFRY